MIKIITTEEKTNSFRPKIWELTKDPYLAYRAENQISKVILNTTEDFDPSLPSKIILTKKGRALLINCEDYKDQNIGLITCLGGFRGYMDIKFYNCEVIVAGKYSQKHCTPVHQFVVIFEDDSKILMKTNCKAGPLNDITVITYEQIITENGYPIEEFEFPENGKIIIGSKFNYYLNKDQKNTLQNIATKIAELGYGVYIGIFCEDGKTGIQYPIPELKCFIDKQQKTYKHFTSSNYIEESEKLWKWATSNN